MTPIFKSGDKALVSNYRPVSLTSIVSRIFEGMLGKHMRTHLELNELISNQQHGFVSAKACVTNLLECQDIVTYADSQRLSTDVLYTDFSKAFDKVSHVKLLQKIGSYGFGLKYINWITDFVKNRKQRVVFGSNYSE